MEKQIRQLGFVCVCAVRLREREGRVGGSFVSVGRAQSSDRAQVWRLFKSLNYIPAAFIYIYLYYYRERKKKGPSSMCVCRGERRQISAGHDDDDDPDVAVL